MPRSQNFFRPWRRAERPLRAEDLPLAFTTWASRSGHFQTSGLPRNLRAKDWFESSATIGRRPLEGTHPPKRSFKGRRRLSTPDVGPTSAGRSAEQVLRPLAAHRNRSANDRYLRERGPRKARVNGRRLLEWACRWSHCRGRSSALQDLLTVISKLIASKPLRQQGVQFLVPRAHSLEEFRHPLCTSGIRDVSWAADPAPRLAAIRCSMNRYRGVQSGFRAVAAV